MLDQRAKQWLLGRALGRALLAGRDRLDLVRAALHRPESVGTVANDQLAALLVTGLPQAGKTFIDVGAHIGSIVAAVVQRSPRIHIVAIEAIPEKAERLRRKFPQASVHACAAGDQDGEVSFFINTRKSGYSSLSGDGAGAAGGNVRELRVPIRRLDALVEHQGVDVIKIDVEGAELGVLLGSPLMMAASRPVVMFESGPADALGLGYTKPGIWQFLAEQDYHLLLPHRVAHDGDALSLEGFVDSHVYPRRTTNYFAVPAERRIEIRDRARALLAIAAG